MAVTMAEPRHDRLIVRVLMMRIVLIFVVVFSLVMGTRIRMACRDMEPDSGSHKRAPATMLAVPIAIRRSKLSRNTYQASRAVNTPSRFSSKEALAAEICTRPSMSIKRAAIPPVTTAPASHPRHATTAVLARWGVSTGRWQHRPGREIPASSKGLTVSSSSLATGVPAPNSNAALAQRIVERDRRSFALSLREVSA
jgi:hypothetical protein